MRKAPFAAPQACKLLSLDRLIKEALISGMGLAECYNSTWGEVIEFVEAYRERKRREYQNLSVIAQKQALLTALYVSGNANDAEIYDFFPFWSQDEIDESLLKKYKNMLLKNSD